MLKYKLQFILILFISQVYSYPVLPFIKSFDKTEYKAGRQNWDISIDQHGIIYFGNNDGLLQYVYGEWNLTNTKYNDKVSALSIVNDTIWTGGEKEFGYYTRGLNRQLEYNYIGNVNYGRVWNIEKSEDIVYFQTDTGILMFNNRTKEELFVSSGGGFFSLTKWNNKIWAVNRAHQIGYFYQGSFQVFKGFREIIKGDILDLIVHEKSLYILVEDFGLIELNELMDINKIQLPKELINDGLFSLASLNENEFGIGSISGGLYIYDLVEKRIVNKFDLKHGLLDNTVLSLLNDDKGNIWLGLDYGISVIKEKETLQSIFNQGASYDIENIGSKKYIASNKGLFISDDENEFELVANTQGQVWNLLNIDSVLYVGHNKGIFIIRDDKSELIYDKSGVMNISRFYNSEYYIIHSYTDSYFAKRNDYKFEFIHKIEDKLDSKFYYDELNDCIWAINDQDELIQFFQRDGKLERKTFRGIVDFYKVNNSVVFYNGDELLERSNNAFRVLKRKPYSLVQGKGIKFITLNNNETSLAVLRDNTLDLLVNINQGEYYSYGKQLSKVGENLLKDMPYLDFDQNILRIANDRGVQIFNPEIKQKNQKGTVSKISSFSYSDNYSSNTLLYPFSNEIISIGKGRKSIKFSFASNSDLSSNLEYRYKLVPLENDWSRWTESSIKEYTNVPSGEYRFILETRLNGIEKDSYKFEFIVDKNWYETNAMLFIYLIIILLLIFALYKLMRNYQRSKLLEQKEQQKLVSNNEMLVKRDSQLIQYAELISKKNEFLIELKDGLSSIKNKAMLKWIGRINKELNNEEKSLIFQNLFSEIHIEFLEVLRNKYPDLNSNDIRLISMIRFNLSTQEIANIQNIHKRSVIVNRYRLKKKLKLDPESDLDKVVREM